MEKRQLMSLKTIRSKIEGRISEEIRPVRRRNAVLIPLVEKEGALHILFDVRQAGIG